MLNQHKLLLQCHFYATSVRSLTLSLPWTNRYFNRRIEHGIDSAHFSYKQPCVAEHNVLTHNPLAHRNWHHIYYKKIFREYAICWKEMKIYEKIKRTKRKFKFFKNIQSAISYRMHYWRKKWKKYSISISSELEMFNFINNCSKDAIQIFHVHIFTEQQI